MLRAEDFAGLVAAEPGDGPQPAGGRACASTTWSGTSWPRPCERAGWNKAAAAALLGVNRDWVRYRIERYGLAASGIVPPIGNSPEQPPAHSLRDQSLTGWPAPCNLSGVSWRDWR